MHRFDATFPTKKLSTLVRKYTNLFTSHTSDNEADGETSSGDLRNRNTNPCTTAELQHLYEKELLMTEKKRKWEARQAGLILLRERKLNEPAVIEDDNIINLSKSSSNEKPTKTVDRRTSRTKRGDVKSRSVNLGGLIGLWKGIESLDKDGEKIPAPGKGLQNRTSSIDRKYLNDRKSSIDRKAERKISVEKKPERKISLGRRFQSDSSDKKASSDKTAALKKGVEQTPPKDKNQTSYRDVEVKDTYKDVRKTQKSVESTVTSLISKSYEAKRQTSKDDTKFSDAKRHPFKDASKSSDWRSQSHKDDRKTSDGIGQSYKEDHRRIDGRKGSQREEGKTDEVKNSSQKVEKLSTTQAPVQTPEIQIEEHEKITGDAPTGKPPINKSLQLSEPLSTSSPDLQRSRPGSLRKGEGSKRHSFRRRSKVGSDNKNLAEDFDKIFKRLSIGSELSISQADISSILEQVSQNQERDKERRKSLGELIKYSEDTNINEHNKTVKTIDDNKNEKRRINDNKDREKTVLNDSTNTIRKQQTQLSPVGRKDIPRTKVSNFEEGMQKERITHERIKANRRNEVSSPTNTNNNLSPNSNHLSPNFNYPSEVSETQQLGENNEKPQKKGGGQKTATQAKLEEIAARREALRRKYLERSHSENSIALEKKERFRRQGFAEGHDQVQNDADKDVNEDVIRRTSEQLTCEVASVTTNTLTSPEPVSPESNSTDSGFSAESVLTQISNKPESLSSSSEEQRADKKKKKNLRKNLANVSDIRTPPTIRKSRDVKKILRRLSLNIPPPTPEEIEEEMLQSQDISEQERKQVVFDKRRRSSNQSRNDSTEDEREIEGKKENVVRQLKTKGNKVMECNNADDLDKIIKANKSGNNNLNALSEQKFKAMRNETLQRSSSTDDPNSRSGRNSENTTPRTSVVRDTFVKEKEPKSAIPKNIITTRRGSVNEKKQKLFEQPKEIPITRTKPVAETRAQLVNGKNDSQNSENENKKAPRKDRMMNREHPSQRTFQKQSEWLERLVTEAAAEADKLQPNELSRSRDSIPVPRRGRKSSSNNEKKPEIDKEAIRQNIVEEPTNLPERKAWLEKLVRRNSVDKKTRLSKTMSLCNLSSLDFGNDGDDEGAPLPRQISVEEISKSIDVENRGNAYLLPSALRKRRSMGNIETEQTYNNCDGGSNVSIPNIHTNGTNDRGGDHMNGDVENDSDDLDPNIKDAIEAIELPNIHERIKTFQRTDKKPSVRERRIPRKQRPKSYAGEHLGQLVFEDGSFRPKDGQLLGDACSNNVISKVISNNGMASSIGRALMADESSEDNNPSETAREAMQRKRQNRRSLFSNQRILAEIAEMEQREHEIIEERTKATTESERHIAAYGRRKSLPIKEYERGCVQEEKGEKLKVYPRGLEAFLQENEVRS